MNRTRIRIVGQSGSGLLTVGDIVSKGLQKAGFYLCADREYPSLIKGGHSCYTINFSDHPLYSLSDTADILVAIDKHSLVAYFDTLKKEGIFIHGYERIFGIADILKKAKRRKIKVIDVKARQLAAENGGNELMTNIILTGMTWKVLGMDFKIIKDLVAKKFAKKPKILEIGLRCLRAGYDVAQVQEGVIAQKPKKKEKTILLDGNHALALGAVHAGVRFYVAYPMSPSSSILTHMALMARKTGMIVKQGEDEITVAQMATGAMYAGTRALCATSGGGYDLMTETVSLAGIIENPLVVVIAQRPGPGTGLPTWTCQGDLNLAVHSAHGEFPRVVVGVSEPEDCFSTIQHAFNIAEEYQVPVVVLTEKVIAESHVTVPRFQQKKIPIKRGLVTGAALKKLKNIDRFAITKSGLSKRWIPGSSDAYYFANGDEHWEDGTLTEDGEEAGTMYGKRMRKGELVKKNIPEPQVCGVKKGADISFIGWGSSRTVMMDMIRIMKKKGVSVNYLHYQYVWPLKEKAAEKFFRENKNVHLIEGNYQGQLGEMVEGQTGQKFKGKLLKWDGRPFFIEDVKKYITKNSKS